MSMEQTPSIGTGAEPSQRSAKEKGSDSRPLFDIEEDLWRAAALNDLSCWVGRALHFVGSVRLAAQQDNGLRQALRSRGIDTMGSEWMNHGFSAVLSDFLASGSGGSPEHYESVKLSDLTKL